LYFPYFFKQKKKVDNLKKNLLISTNFNVYNALRKQCHMLKKKILYYSERD